MKLKTHLKIKALTAGGFGSLLFALLLLIPAMAPGQDFVYKPKNPAFGGETFNYQWLLSSAQAQDPYEDPDALDLGFEEETAIEEFTKSLNRQILSQLSRELVTLQFGEDGLEEGTYIIGDFGIDIIPTLNGISITILDINTGDQTIIEIPFY